MKASKLFLITILVRLLFTVLAFLADSLAPDYDNSMMAEIIFDKKPIKEQPQKSFSSSSFDGSNDEQKQQQQQRRVFSLLDPLMRWDAAHFRHVAKHGYTHEHLCAFFPEIGNIYKFFGLVEEESGSSSSSNNLYQTKTPSISNEIVFLVFHMCCSGLSAVLLRSIVLDLLAIFVVQSSAANDDDDNENPTHSIAALVGHSGFVFRGATIVWLLNPAAVFFSAAYTETYFALTSFMGIWCMHRLHEECGFFFSESPFSNASSSSSPQQQQQQQKQAVYSEQMALQSLRRRIARGTVANPASEKRKKSSNSNNSEASSAALPNLGGGREEDAPPQEVKSPTKTYTFSLEKKKKDDDWNADEVQEQQQQQQQQDSLLPRPKLVKCIGWLFAATVAFTLGTRLRSNGILLCGFLLHFGGLTLWFHKRRSLLPASSRGFLLLLSVAATVVVFLPYHAHVQSCYKSFCAGASSAAEFEQKLLLDSNDDASVRVAVETADKQLCRKGPGGYYSGVQHKYWKVGLFEYYTLNNVPNFIIAAPTFVFCALGLLHFLSVATAKHERRNNSNTKKSGVDLIPEASASEEIVITFLSALSSIQSAHLVYLFAQLLIALAIMNVQVVTRFVSSTPALYLLYGFVLGSARASAVKEEGRSGSSSSSSWWIRRLLPRWIYSERMKYFCLGFCMVWSLVGTAMFPNFMPWT